MDEPSYFQNALSNYVTDAACGGAVRHLTDIGYTLDQIVERLDYPAPRAKVQRIMMDYLYENHMLLREEPSEALFAPKPQFVQEQDALGRRSMRKIIFDQNGQNHVTNASGSQWKESVYDPKRDGKLTELLHRKCEQNGAVYNYLSCPFGTITNDQYSQNQKYGQSGKSIERLNDGRGGKSKSEEPEKLLGARTAAEEKLDCLNGRQKEYLQGIRWDQPVLYHRLDQRMLEIIGKLYEAGVYSGAAFFAASGEKVAIPLKQPFI